MVCYYGAYCAVYHDQDVGVVVNFQMHGVYGVCTTMTMHARPFRQDHGKKRLRWIQGESPAFIPHEIKTQNAVLTR